MKIDAARQSIGAIISTFVVLVAASVAGSLAAPSQTAELISSPLGNLIDSLFRNPLLRYPAVIAIIVVNAILITRIMVIYRTTFGRSFLPLTMYGIAALGIVSPFGSIAAPAAVLLLVLSTDQAVAAFRRAYRFEAVFKSAFALGFVPLIYPSAAVLLLTLPVTLVLYQRTPRETAVAVGGVLLPFLLCSTGWWFAGYPWGYIADTFAGGLVAPGGGSLPFMTGESVFPSVLCVFYGVMICGSIALLIKNYNHYPNRVRKIYIHILLLLLCCGAMFVLPSSNPIVSIGLTAVPASVIGTHFFIRTNRWLGLGVYLVLLVLFFASAL